MFNDVTIRCGCHTSTKVHMDTSAPDLFHWNIMISITDQLMSTKATSKWAAMPHVQVTCTVLDVLSIIAVVSGSYWLIKRKIKDGPCYGISCQLPSIASNVYQLLSLSIAVSNKLLFVQGFRSNWQLFISPLEFHATRPAKAAAANQTMIICVWCLPPNWYSFYVQLHCCTLPIQCTKLTDYLQKHWWLNWCLTLASTCTELWSSDVALPVPLRSRQRCNSAIWYLHFNTGAPLASSGQGLPSTSTCHSIKYFMYRV